VSAPAFLDGPSPLAKQGEDRLDMVALDRDDAVAHPAARAEAALDLAGELLAASLIEGRPLDSGRGLFGASLWCTPYLLYQQVAFGRITPAAGGQQIYDMIVRLFA
jgi:hypothetical protein